MMTIIIAVGAMAATGGLATMINNIKPTRAMRKELIEQQFTARKFAGIAADAAAEIVDSATEAVTDGNGDGATEAVTDGNGDGAEGSANPQ